MTSKYLLIGSTEAYSGKSGIVLGIGHQLLDRGIEFTYAKPIGTYFSDDDIEEDIQFITNSLKLSEKHVLSSLVNLAPSAIYQSLKEPEQNNYAGRFPSYIQEAQGDLVVIEGAGNMSEGILFDLSLPEMAESIGASVLLISRYTSLLVVEALVAAKKQLGSRLIGVLINDIPTKDQDIVATIVKPFLEKQGIEVLGMIPRSDLLRSVSVREIVHHLEAEVLCRSDRLDLMVESLTIGAMNVNSALEYFRKGKNMAVITGGDRTDLQMAALETSTQCLILTGHVPPNPLVLSRAEYLEIPILSVNLDTLTTVEIVDSTFGKVRLQESIKVECIQELMDQHFNTEKLLEKLGITPVLTS